MKVSFIIPLYNCLPLTQAMLASLQSTLPAGLEHEIILVDDGSTDGTRAWLESLAVPCRVHLNEKNLGFAATCNRGAAAATGEILFFLNNDLVFQAHWLEPMLAAFDRGPQVGLIGNVQVSASNGEIDHVGIFFNAKGKPEHERSSLLVRPPWPLPACRAVAALTGACFAIRRDTWTRLGGFDEMFINGSEDIDLCLRARAAGLGNYVALHSVVRHHVSASPGRKRRDEQNTRRLVQRWRQQICDLALPAWCMRYLELQIDPAEHRSARQILWYVLGLTATPPPEAQAGIARALDLELARWSELLDAVNLQPPPTTGRTAQI
jgi:O-antigen biosynthesis protein